MSSLDKNSKSGIKRSSSSFSCCQRAIRVRFYRNGDRYFTGFTFPISFNRFREFDVLLRDLSNSNFCDKTILPCGVRFIFTINGVRIKNVHQMEEGGSYVCCSANNFVPLDYANETHDPKWKTTKKFVDDIVPVVPLQFKLCKAPYSQICLTSNSHGSAPSGSSPSIKNIGAKLIYVVRNGPGRPRQVFQWLLNCKTAPTFGKVLDDLSSLLKLDSGSVKHLYTTEGKEILSLEDLFTEDPVFIAFGSDIIDKNDAYLTSQELTQTEKMKKPSGKFMVVEGKEDQEPNGLQKLTEKYLIGNEIGIGNFAVVKECRDKKKNTLVALKIIDRKKCEKNKDKLEKELVILKKIKHINVISLINQYETQDFIYLILELSQDGNMVDFILGTHSYSEQDVSGMIHNIASGLHYLHSLNITHRDIKFENILIQRDLSGLTRLRICDFGLACEMDERPMTVVCGTPCYMSPEILMQEGYDNKVDVWSMGVMFYILLVGSPPFKSATNDFNEVFEKIMKGEYYRIPENPWTEVSPEAKSLLGYLMMRDPKQRYSAKDVLSFPWVAEDNIARTIDLWPTVGQGITQFFTDNSKRSKAHPFNFLADTALDKDSNYFETEEQQI